jgi:D-alanine-D-alanine ligase-like ATP-grasp enzyme
MKGRLRVAAAALDAEVLCEQFISGDEVTVPVLGPGESARALPVIRIVRPTATTTTRTNISPTPPSTWCPAAARR